MKVSYNELYASNVFDNLESGNKVIMCDFTRLTMVDCVELKVSQLQYYVNKSGIKFFREIVTEDTETTE